MSRIGKKPIAVPKGVKVTINGRDVTVEGKLGTLSMTHRPEVAVAWDESEAAVTVSIAGQTEADITIQTCWDADRLDLGRVWIIPDPDRLCTEPARDPALIERGRAEVPIVPVGLDRGAVNSGAPLASKT